MNKAIQIILLFFTLNFTIKTVDAQSIQSGLNYNIHFAVQQYDHSLYNKMVGRQVVDNQNGIQTKTGTWEVSKVEKQIDTETSEFLVTFRLTKGFEKSAATLVEFQFSDWNKDNYVLLPASAYNGNRYESRRIPYSPKLNDARDIGKDKPMIISDIPRLNIADGVSLIQERSGSMALPCVGFQSVTTQKGFFLTTLQANTYGDFGMNIEESRDRKNAVISLCSPLVRERVKYQICDNQAPSTDQPADFKQGDEVKFTFRVHQFKAEKIQTIFDKYSKSEKNCVQYPLLLHKFLFLLVMI
ncbi:MAG: hypothetical protein WCG93_10905 [Paludibacter sp.]